MKKIVAAVDDSLAATPVLTTAGMVAKLLGAEVEAVHVEADAGRVARAAAESAAVPLRLLSGDVVEAVITAARDADVVMTVVGARATPGSARPLGATALAIARALASPLVVVPPDAVGRAELRRILVPVEGDRRTAPLPGAIVEIARSAGASAIDVVVLHVLEERRLPAFTDQPQHEQPAWAHEFVLRFCPWGIGRVSLETRVGRSDEVVPQAAHDSEVDLVALGWAQELGSGHARVVRATLERGGVPVMLVPVRVVAPSA